MTRIVNSSATRITRLIRGIMRILYQSSLFALISR
ncbi:MAG: hypothetical protein JWQ49_5911 [Edaphobacter sp.]|nr:hypothetical protein [Edaphobacter sp.]